MSTRRDGRVVDGGGLEKAQDRLSIDGYRLPQFVPFINREFRLEFAKFRSCPNASRQPIAFLRRQCRSVKCTVTQEKRRVPHRVREILTVKTSPNIWPPYHSAAGISDG